MKRTVFQLLFLIYFLASGCTSEYFIIPGYWIFTVILKNQDYEIRALNMPQNQMTVIIYYPEICGFCLSQINAIKEELSEVKPEKRQPDIHLICMISTLDTVTMQYYLDEKMDYINEIYLDTDDNFRKEFFSEIFLEYPYYFVIQGNTIKGIYEMNNDKSLSQLISLFCKSG